VRLSDFIAPSRVIIPLDCETLDQARTAVLERLVASGAIDDFERLRSRVAEERGEDMVAIADHAFLLHYRTDTATSLQVAIGICRDGIRRVLGEETSQHAPVVAVVVGPPRLAARQLQVVHALGRLLAKRESIDALVDAQSPEAVVRLPMLVEHDLPEQLLVRDLMTERARTTKADVPLRVAARELIGSGLAALCLTKDGGRRDDSAGAVRRSRAAGGAGGGVDDQQGRRTRSRGARRKARRFSHARGHRPQTDWTLNRITKWLAISR
jgi:mannitol/fructose-specific phosphotransferase system IIA component (Ntr-type)